MWSSREKGILFFTLGIMLGFLIMGRCSNANAADHAVVSFDNAEHLTALQDSVVGVMDTTTEIHCWYLDSDTTVTHYWEVTNCRRLVGVTVVTHIRWERCPTAQDPWQFTPGKALIFYEKVKQ
jgi:hypothetical protein